VTDYSYEQICRVKYSYGYAIDTRDWSGLASVFADQVVVDFRDIGYPVVLTLTRQEWIAEIRKLIDGLDATVHQISSLLCEPVDGDLVVRSCVTARHVLHGPGRSARCYEISGWYTDRLKVVGGDWRIAATAISCKSFSGDRSVMREAIQRAREGSLM